MAAPTRGDIKPLVVHLIAIISGYDDAFVAAGDPATPRSLENALAPIP